MHDITCFSATMGGHCFLLFFALATSKATSGYAGFYTHRRNQLAGALSLKKI